MIRFFTLGMLAAFAVSLLTGKAYYRRVIERDYEPPVYWLTVASYLVLGLLEPIIWIMQQFR